MIFTPLEGVRFNVRLGAGVRGIGRTVMIGVAKIEGGAIIVGDAEGMEDSRGGPAYWGAPTTSFSVVV